MATPIDNRIPLQPRAILRPLFLLPVLLVFVFLALPWSVEHKAHMLLHGLCAQRPSHTYRFDDRLLPFDARMTGIYGGYLITTVVLVLRGAHRWCRPPTSSRLVVLAVLGGAMALDGVNSFLLDNGLAHLYEPRNWLRLTTGMTAGVVLGFALCFLMASSIWLRVDTRRQTLEDWRVVPIIGLLWLPVALAVGSGFGPLYVPLTLLLVFAAGLALTTLALVVLVILRRREFTFTGADSLGAYGVVAICLAAVAMAVLAVGRWLLEQAVGNPPLT